MTNLEWLYNEKKETLITLLSDASVWCVNKKGEFIENCGQLPCTNCKFFIKGYSCDSQRKEWLNAEHEDPLLFPIGTPVEVADKDNRYMGYYNGFDNGFHYVIHYKHFLGMHCKDGELCGVRCKAKQLREVGD